MSDLKIVEEAIQAEESAIVSCQRGFEDLADHLVQAKERHQALLSVRRRLLSQLNQASDACYSAKTPKGDNSCSPPEIR